MTYPAPKWPIGNNIKTYKALLSQAGTAPPSPTVLINTLGEDIIWTRTATGEYHGACTKITDPDSTALNIGASAFIATYNTDNPNGIYIGTADNFTFTFSDNWLNKTLIEITLITPKNV